MALLRATYYRELTSSEYTGALLRVFDNGGVPRTYNQFMALCVVRPHVIYTLFNDTIKCMYENHDIIRGLYQDWIGLTEEERELYMLNDCDVYERAMAEWNWPNFLDQYYNDSVVEEPSYWPLSTDRSFIYYTTAAIKKYADNWPRIAQNWRHGN